MDTQNVSNLIIGKKVKIFDGKNPIDDLIIKEIDKGGSPSRDEITVESLNLYPGETFKFALIGTGWALLFEGAFSELNFNTKKVYAIQ